MWINCLHLKKELYTSEYHDSIRRQTKRKIHKTRHRRIQKAPKRLRQNPRNRSPRRKSTRTLKHRRHAPRQEKRRRTPPRQNKRRQLRHRPGDRRQHENKRATCKEY